MNSFYNTHTYLLKHLKAPARRYLMDEINWNDRLIGIKGTRGVGKTTFLLQYAKENFKADDRTCLYVNTNNFYIQTKGLPAFAEEFQEQGGRVLLIDQVFKLSDWSKQLRDCHENFPNLKIVFTGSSVMRLKEENPELNGIAQSYNLRGFSFREYLNLITGENFPAYTLDEIISGHEEIAKEITSRTQPRKYFKAYLEQGFYPFCQDSSNFQENLLKTMNMIIEVDILLLKQIELKYLPKIKELFYLLTTGGTGMPNVSKLSATLGMSRATVMNYIKYLADARLINILYHKGDAFPKKPARIVLHNSNLMHSFYPMDFDNHDYFEAFFCNTLWKDHTVNKSSKAGVYVVDGDKDFKIVEHGTRQKSKSTCLFAVNDTDIGHKNQIPLYMLGFLY